MESDFILTERHPHGELEGRLSWRIFVSRHSLATISLFGSFVILLLSTPAGPGKRFIAGALAVLAGSTSLLHLGIWLASVVTRFHLVDGTLTFSRLCRRARSVNLEDVFAIADIGTACSVAAVWLRDGTTLCIPTAELSSSQELIKALNSARPSSDLIEGGLNLSGVAATLVHQWLATCILLAISAVALMLIAVVLRAGNLVADPSVFLVAGVLLLALCATGFYFAVLRHWMGCVRSFRWDERCLEYRTCLSRALHQCFTDEIEEALTRRIASSQGNAGTWRQIRFRDGRQVKLHIGILQNAEPLFRALETDLKRRADRYLPRVLPTVTSDHPLWPGLKRFLEEDEEAYWLGQPCYARLRNEMSAEVVFGLIPFAFSVGFVALALAVPRIDAPLLLWLLGAVFGGIGIHFMSAPLRYCLMLRDTLYAVTSKRAVVVNGVQ